MMISRRYLLAATLAVGATVLAVPVGAQGVPFDRTAFDAARKAGMPVLIEVSAPWCPTCRAQKPIIAEIAKQPQFATLKVFVVDFDTQKDLLREFNAQAQSTLIVFKGGREMGRSVGDTNPQSIATLVAKAI